MTLNNVTKIMPISNNITGIKLNINISYAVTWNYGFAGVDAMPYDLSNYYKKKIYVVSLKENGMFEFCRKTKRDSCCFYMDYEQIIKDKNLYNQILNESLTEIFKSKITIKKD